MRRNREAQAGFAGERKMAEHAPKRDKKRRCPARALSAASDQKMIVFSGGLRAGL